MSLIVTVISAAFNIMLPFGFTFGAFVVFLWSIPLLPKIFKSIF